MLSTAHVPDSLLCYREVQWSTVRRRMTDLKQKTVLVTGASGGFGKHMTDQLLAKGCNLIVTDLHAETLDRLKAEFSQASGNIRAMIGVDLSTQKGCRYLADTCAVSARHLQQIWANTTCVFRTFTRRSAEHPYCSLSNSASRNARRCPST